MNLNTIGNKVKYPQLPQRKFASLDQEQYIKERLNYTLSWYDKKSVICKKRYLAMRSLTVIGSAIVPVLVNLTFKYIDIITTILSVIVVLLVSLESVYHYREQWVNYRSTEQYLRKEYFLFTAKEGPYFKMEAHDAYRLFVERVESAIEAENTSTLQVMTTASDISKNINIGNI